MDNSECQTHSVAIDPMLRGTNFSFSLKDLDVGIDRFNPYTGFDSLHSSHIKNSKRCCRNLSLACIVQIFINLNRIAHYFDSFFPEEYEYLDNLFPTRPDLPKFYVEGLKITKWLFLDSVNAEDNKHFQCYACGQIF